MNRVRRFIVAGSTVAFVTANCSCSHYARVPRGAYHKIETSDSTRWKIETNDGRVYLVSRFELTDSTLVIEAFDPSVQSLEETYPFVTAMPYTIELDDVRSIKKRVEVTHEQGLLATAILSLVALAALALWSLKAAFGGSNS